LAELVRLGDATLFLLIRKLVFKTIKEFLNFAYYLLFYSVLKSWNKTCRIIRYHIMQRVNEWKVKSHCC